MGNGLASYEMNDNSLVFFSYYHGLLGTRLWTELQKFCCRNGSCDFYKNLDQNCTDRVSPQPVVSQTVSGSGLRDQVQVSGESGFPCR